MNPEPKNFDSLRRILILKRHEQPPPGFYDRFSRDVMARIKAGEMGDKIGLEPVWYRRVLGMFELKPVFAGAFGMGVCALLISGVVSTESSSPTVATDTPDMHRANFVVDTAPPPTGTEIALKPSDTNPVVQNSTLFQGYQPQIVTQPAAGRYWVPAGN
jgi:hypothetical protein